jgi:hypothetical protein
MMVFKKIITLFIPILILPAIASVGVLSTSCFGGDDYKEIPREYLDIRFDDATQKTTLFGLSVLGQSANFSQFDTLVIPTNVEVIADNAFNQAINPCESFDQYIENIDYEKGNPSNLAKIGIAAFYEMSNLTDITLPASFTTFSTLCFAKCPEMSFIEFDGSSIVSFIPTMLDDTSFNTNIDYCEGIFLFQTKSIAEDFANTSG